MFGNSKFILAHIVGVVILASTTLSANEKDHLTMPEGRYRLALMAGGVGQDYDWQFGASGDIRMGLPFGLEYAFPAALGVSLYKTPAGSGVLLAAGIMDLGQGDDGEILWHPAIYLTSQIAASKSAFFRVSVDFSGLEQEMDNDTHPLWFKVTGAFVIDMGPYLSIGAGFAVQRLVLGENEVIHSRRSAWVGDSRLSIGGVRSHPFEDLPSFAVHLNHWLDMIALVRADIDRDGDTTDIRVLGGIKLDLMFGVAN